MAVHVDQIKQVVFSGRLTIIGGKSEEEIASNLRYEWQGSQYSDMADALSESVGDSDLIASLSNNATFKFFRSSLAENTSAEVVGFRAITRGTSNDYLLFVCRSSQFSDLNGRLMRTLWVVEVRESRLEEALIILDFMSNQFLLPLGTIGSLPSILKNLEGFNPANPIYQKNNTRQIRLSYTAEELVNHQLDIEFNDAQDELKGKLLLQSVMAKQENVPVSFPITIQHTPEKFGIKCALVGGQELFPSFIWTKNVSSSELTRDFKIRIGDNRNTYLETTSNQISATMSMLIEVELKMASIKDHGNSASKLYDISYEKLSNNGNFDVYAASALILSTVQLKKQKPEVNELFRTWASDQKNSLNKHISEKVSPLLIKEEKEKLDDFLKDYSLVTKDTPPQIIDPQNPSLENKFFSRSNLWLFIGAFLVTLIVCVLLFYSTTIPRDRISLVGVAQTETQESIVQIDQKLTEQALAQAQTQAFIQQTDAVAQTETSILQTMQKLTEQPTTTPALMPSMPPVDLVATTTHTPTATTTHTPTATTTHTPTPYLGSDEACELIIDSTTPSNVRIHPDIDSMDIFDPNDPSNRDSLQYVIEEATRNTVRGNAYFIFYKIRIGEKLGWIVSEAVSIKGDCRFLPYFVNDGANFPDNLNSGLLILNDLSTYLDNDPPTDPLQEQFKIAPNSHLVIQIIVPNPNPEQATITQIQIKCGGDCQGGINGSRYFEQATTDIIQEHDLQPGEIATLHITNPTEKAQVVTIETRYD